MVDRCLRGIPPPLERVVSRSLEGADHLPAGCDAPPPEHPSTSLRGAVDHPKGSEEPASGVAWTTSKAPMNHLWGWRGPPRGLRCTCLRGADDHPKGSDRPPLGVVMTTPEAPPSKGFNSLSASPLHRKSGVQIGNWAFFPLEGLLSPTHSRPSGSSLQTIASVAASHRRRTDG